MRRLRIGIAVSLVGFLALFFLPLIPFTRMIHASCVFSCAPIPSGGAYSGYDSIGYLMTGWGAIYSGWMGGYIPPVVSYDLSGELTTLTGFGALLAIVYPIAVGCVGMFGPEIVKWSRLSRVVFAGLGAFVFGFSSLILVSEQPLLNPVFILEGAWLVPVGGLMIAYGMRRWMFRVDAAA
jgi:hypothetical protein